jgi:hypothetical protein
MLGLELPQYIQALAMKGIKEGNLSEEYGPFFPTCSGNENEYLASQYSSVSIEKCECKTCPEGSKCNGGNFSSILTLAGYWRVPWEEMEPTFVKCLSEQACPNDLQSGYACLEGSNGALCANCLDGYAPGNGQGSCSKCPSKGTSFMLIFGIFLGTIALILLFIFVALREESLKNNSESSGDYSVGMVLKVLLSHVQQISLMKNFGFSWPPQVLAMMEFFNFAGSISDFTFSFKCFSYGNNLGFIDGQFMYSFIVLVMFSPMIVFIGVALISYMFAKSIRRKAGYSDSISVQNSPVLEIDSNMSGNGNFIHSSSWFGSLMKFCFITTLVVMHPKLTEQVMKLFACVKVYDRTFLLANMSIDCDSPQHRLYSLVLSIPFVFICFGIPVLLFYKVLSIKKRYSKNLDHILWSEYAYITRSYRIDVSMWESVLMIRKMGIAFLSVFLSTKSFEIQTLWGSLWLLLFFALHSEYHPFKSSFINRLENVSLLFTLATFALGGYLGPSGSFKQEDGDSVRWISFATVGINLSFLIYIVVIGVLKGITKISIAAQFFHRMTANFGFGFFPPKSPKVSEKLKEPVVVESVIVSEPKI